MPLTASRARELVNYCPETGLFTWAQNRGTNKVAGKPCGYWRKDGYLFLTLDKEQYLAHRVAWLIMTGAWPKHQIDHADLNRSNNAFLNLRDATPGQNVQNKRVRKDSKSGLKGAQYIVSLKKWRGRIVRGGKTEHLGLYDTAEEAHAVFCAAAKRLHGQFFRAG
jgi:hypothetical protein